MEAKHLMTKKPVCIGLNEPVRHILDILSTCTHNGFPVIYSSCSLNRVNTSNANAAATTTAAGGGSNPSAGSAGGADASAAAAVAAHHSGLGCNTAVAGMISRKHLMILLMRRAWRASVKELTPTEFADASNWYVFVVSDQHLKNSISRRYYTSSNMHLT